MKEVTTTPSKKNTYSLASIIALVSAILSFMTGALPAMILAGVAIVLGVLGICISMSPSKRGGFASTFAIIVGLISIVAALVKAVFLWLI